MSVNNKRSAVVALGGNAIAAAGEPDTVAIQFRHTRESLGGIVELARRGYNLAITHGNGPQIGAALLRVELSAGKTPNLPLGLLVADTQGSMGYMIEQSLQNRLAREGIPRKVVTIVTQVLVASDDPGLIEPTKFIGEFYSHEEAQQLMSREGWKMKLYRGSNIWRRVVGSPKPLGIINRDVIMELVHAGRIVIASGGGGIPVYDDPELGLEGIDAVIDKDRAAAILARDIEANELIILTNIDAVYLNYGKANQKPLRKLTVSKAMDYSQDGHFAVGSMGPKIEAAIQFLKRGGERAIICALDQVEPAINGEVGTEIVA